MSDAKIVSARIPLEILEKIDQVASDRGKKRGAVVREALEYYLEEWAQYGVALARLKNPLDKVLSEKDFFDELGWDI